jgi:hypothetical protein|tara:strand:- start:58 stop:687 length:630 start_codon:yes stop_codon:yes gene_type:complete
MSKSSQIIKNLKKKYPNHIEFNDENILKKYKKKNTQYLYFILWNSKKDIFSWGTMSGSSDRIRKSSILNKKLTGKYDRRVDYLMLKKIIGFDKIYLFETIEKSTIIESEIKNLLNVKSCFYGLKGTNRDEISQNLYSKFKLTDHSINQSETDKKNFDLFFHEIFLGKKRHPENPKRTFFYGDCLEPGFLKKINYGYLESSIENMLDVVF